MQKSKTTIKLSLSALKNSTPTSPSTTTPTSTTAQGSNPFFSNALPPEIQDVEVKKGRGRPRKPAGIIFKQFV